MAFFHHLFPDICLAPLGTLLFHEGVELPHHQMLVLCTVHILAGVTAFVTPLIFLEVIQFLPDFFLEIALFLLHFMDDFRLSIELLTS
jgi:hypothetical protein